MRFFPARASIGAAANVALTLVLGQASATVNVQWSTIGDVGNAPDGATNKGAVGYGYLIGKFEITNTQYAEFLNAKATSDPYSLYQAYMGTLISGAIVRSGTSGNYTYLLKDSSYASKPVNYITWAAAIRFVNWMNNRQDAGDTETGAYTLLGGTGVPSNATTVTRNPGARIFLPSEDEWYKAAYHQPASQGGDADDYWEYPTRSNTMPNSDQPPGDPAIWDNAANFYRNDGLPSLPYNGGYAVTGTTSISGVSSLTNVGAYVYSPGPSGTFDQGGNLQEWNDSIVQIRISQNPDVYGPGRGRRGGGSGLSYFYLNAANANNAEASGGVMTASNPQTFRIAARPLEGDANVDLKVDSVDFGIYLAHNGMSSGAEWTDADFGFDGKVETTDFNFIAGNFGQTYPAPPLGAVVPEPATMSLSVLTSLFVSRCRCVRAACC